MQYVYTLYAPCIQVVFQAYTTCISEGDKGYTIGSVIINRTFVADESTVYRRQSVASLATNQGFVSDEGG